MTDIIATVATYADVQILAEMIRSGMSVAGMNFSHGDYAFHARMAGLVREAAKVAGKPVALLADLQGAKVRVGWLAQAVPVAVDEPIVLVGMHVNAHKQATACPPTPPSFPSTSTWRRI